MSGAERNLILVWIYQANGKADWYSLCKLLLRKGIVKFINVGVIAQKFIDEGLVELVCTADPNIIYYKVTPTGSEIAQKLIDEKGLEYFSDPLKHSNDFGEGL